MYDVVPIDASGNLTLPATGLTVTADAAVQPVVVNIN